MMRDSGGAVISLCGLYRYELWRCWDADRPCAVFVMLNPSTADACKDDPTIRRCCSFAESWGCGSVRVVNLYAYRSSDPCALFSCEDPVGPENDAYIERVVGALGVHIVVAAWGAIAAARQRVRQMLPLLGGREVHCLAVNRDGSPKHPLYCRSDLVPIRWDYWADGS